MKTGAPGVVYFVTFPSASTAPTAMVNLELTIPSRLPSLLLSEMAGKQKNKCKFGYRHNKKK